MYNELARKNTKSALRTLLRLKKYMEIHHKDIDEAIISVMNDVVVDELTEEGKKILDSLKGE